MTRLKLEDVEGLLLLVLGSTSGQSANLSSSGRVGLLTAVRNESLGVTYTVETGETGEAGEAIGEVGEAMGEVTGDTGGNSNLALMSLAATSRCDTGSM